MSAMVDARPVLMLWAMRIGRRLDRVFVTVFATLRGRVLSGLNASFVVNRAVTHEPNGGLERAKPHAQKRDTSHKAS